MKAILFLTLSILVGSSTNAQEKFEEFTTTHATVAGYEFKTDILFELYQDSLVMTFTNKRVVKQMKKNGASAYVTYIASSKKEQNGGIVQYVYKSDAFKATILPNNSVGGSSVRIQTKDDFNGEVTEQIYVSI